MNSEKCTVTTDDFLIRDTDNIVSNFVTWAKIRLSKKIAKIVVGQSFSGRNVKKQLILIIILRGFYSSIPVSHWGEDAGVQGI